MHNNNITFSDLQAIASHYGGGKERKTKDGYVTLCPLHGDKKPSLSIKVASNGGLLTHCFSGCDDMAVKRKIEADFPQFFNGRKPHNDSTSKQAPTDYATMPVRIWNKGKSLSDLCLRYLVETRGIDISQEEARSLFRENRHKGKISLIAPYRKTPQGPVEALYRIFLKDGNPPLKTGCADLGPVKGNAVWLGTPGKELAVCEGLETSLSFFTVTKIPTAVTGGKNNLGGVRIPSSVKTVYLLVDQDIKKGTSTHTGQDAAKEAASVYESQGYKVFLVTPSDATFDKDVGTKLDFNDLSPEEIQERFKKRIPISKLRARDETQFPEPRPIESELPPVMPYDPDLLPSPLSEYVSDVAERMPCPMEFVAAPLLVVLGSLIGTSARLQMRQKDTGWKVVPNLWGALIGRPSTKKTPALKAVLGDTLDPLIKKAEEEYRPLRAKAEASLEAFQAKRNALKKRMGTVAHALQQGKQGVSETDLERLKKELAELEEPEIPSERRYLIHDATIEVIVELLNHNPRGLLYFRDELTGLFRRCEQQGRESDLQFLLEAWNGTGSHSHDRIGRGHIMCKNLCLSILGGIQPDRLRHYVLKTINGDNDGFIQRIQLIVYPEQVNISGWKDRPPNEEIIQKIRELSFKIAYKLNEPVRLKFMPEAQEIFYDFEKAVYEKSQVAGHQVIEAHLVKYLNLFGKLSLIFYLVKCLHGDKEIVAVDTTSALLSKAWCEFLESHMYRIYALGISDAKNETARRLGRKLIALNLGGQSISLRDLRRKHWAFLQGEGALEESVKKLEEHGWLIKQTTETKRGRSPSPRYIVNPRITQIPQD